ncbi:hypothetical protein JW916_03810 [Candidatus Sumerlaeota bacterium]|nr:hypothetical protein [Candidatus Sumerlaeota bacterium]
MTGREGGLFLLLAIALTSSLHAEPVGWDRPDVPSGSETDSNRERDEEDGRAVWKRILLFLPDRILDCADMVTFGAGIGIGLGAEAHATRWAGLGMQGHGEVGIHWYYNRNLTPLIVDYASLIVFGPFQAYAVGFAGAGTAWSRGRPGTGTQTFDEGGLFSLDDSIVQDGWWDPWGIGASVFLVFAGVEAEVHPIEIADCVVGLVTFGFVDISRDDFANPDRTECKTGLPVD